MDDTDLGLNRFGAVEVEISVLLGAAAALLGAAVALLGAAAVLLGAAAVLRCLELTDVNLPIILLARLLRAFPRLGSEHCHCISKASSIMVWNFMLRDRLIAAVDPRWCVLLAPL